MYLQILLHVVVGALENKILKVASVKKIVKYNLKGP